LGTNGLLKESDLEKLKRYRCIQSIAISIDGPPEIHNRLRNSPLAYQRAVATLKKISGGRFLTVIYSLLLPQDVWRIEFLLNLAKELRVDRLTFMPEMFYSSQEVALSLEHLNLSYPEDIFVEVKEEKLDLQEMIRTIEILRRLRRKKGIFAPIFPRACYKYPREFFSGRIDEKKKLICKHFHSFTVIENGDILLCPFIYRKVGNIKEGGLQEAWNSQVMREMRMKILKNNLLPICRRCCSLDYL
jgi:radical SAM protein with 4Fe4S-binding SPASM domain